MTVSAGSAVRGVATPAVPASRLASRLAVVAALTRPATWTASAAAVAVGALLAPPPWWHVGPELLWAACVTACVVAAANVVNDVHDVEADRINRPSRPLPTGAISVDAARSLAVALLAVATVPALALGWRSAVWVAALAAGSIVYSAVVKRTGFPGHLMTAVLFGNTVLFGGHAGGGVDARVWLAACEVTLVILGREVLKSLPDEVGDRAVGTRTAAVVVGRRWSVVAYLGASCAAVAVAGCGALAGIAPPLHAVGVAAGVTAPAVVTAAPLLRSHSDRHLRRALVVSSTTWVTGLAALMLIGRP